MARNQTLAGLLLLVSLAAALRFPGLGFLLPYAVEPDPHIPVQVRLIETADPDRGEVMDWAKYPLFTAYLTIALSDPAPLPAAGSPREAHLAAASDNVLRVRRSQALLSLLLIPAAFLLARRFTSGPWPLVAAALMATSHLAIHFATQARPHGGAAPWPALTVWACLLLVDRPTWRRCLGVTACGAMAVGTLQSSMALGFPVLTAFLIARNGGTWKRAARLLVPLAGLAAAIGLAYPFFFESPALQLESGQLNQGGHKLMLDAFDGRGFRTLSWSLWSWDPALAIGLGFAALASFAALLRGPRTRDRRALLVVLAYVLPMGGVLGMYARSYERFLLPLLPFLAAWIAWALGRLAAGHRGRARLAAALALVLLAGSGAVAARLAQLRIAPSTYEQAAEWVAANVPPEGEARVWLTRPMILPLYKTPESDASDLAYQPNIGGRALNWGYYQREVLGTRRSGPSWDLRYMPFDGASSLQLMRKRPGRYLRQLGPGGFVVSEVFELSRNQTALRVRQNAMRKHFERAEVFRPDHPGSTVPHPLQYQEETLPKLFHRARRVLFAESLGPVLEIFRIPSWGDNRHD